MPIHTKKAAIRNREVFFNNQISNVFVNNGGRVSINPYAYAYAIPKYDVKTATTSLAVSGTYRIPLVSTTSGNQGLNTSASLLYNTNTNTLQVQNLTTTYLPQCSQVPTETNQLVNKAYLDQYVGSYNQLWIYDDWLTGDVSGSLKWEVSTNTISSSVISEPGHAGIVRLRRNLGQNGYMKLNDKIGFTSKTIKCVRFLVRPFATNSGNINSVDLRLHLGGYSPDPYDIGQNWQSVSDNFTASCARIRWSSELGKFCSVGNAGRAVTSDDGLNWRESSTGLGNINGVCWSPQKSIFVAVAYTGGGSRCATSPDGLVWTLRSSLSNLIDWSDVCWSPELSRFVAVGNLDVSETIKNSNVAVSDDGGITWVAATSGVMNYYWRSVCWSAELGLFCAVSLNSLSSTNRIMISKDGYNWDKISVPGGVLSGICWSPELGLFCATGYSNILVSSDGKIWTTTPTGGTLTFHQITWAAEIGLFCTVSDNGAGNNQVIVSRDGYNWTTATSGVVATNWYGIAWSPELSIFCAMSYGTQNQRIMITNPLYRTPTTKSAYWSLTAGSQTGTFTLTDNIKWNCFVSRYGNGNPQGSYTAGSLANKWVLFEIEINDQKPSFYITVIGETNRTLVYKELINTIDSTALIQPSIIFRSTNKGTSGAVPIIDIDYVDILYNKL